MAIYRQRAERSLTAALERHQLLAKEVNHRINNSLQIVSSMLHLQTTATQNPEVQHALRDASTRIAAVARAHQRLYSSEKIDTVDLGAYLGDICGDLGKAMPHCRIDFSAAPDINCATDTAIPVALLVNELITNSAKYAYPDGACEVWVEVSRSDGGISISVRDQGIGLPADFDIKSGKRLGMRLVTALSSQVKADLQVHRHTPGTEFLLRFPTHALPADISADLRRRCRNKVVDAAVLLATQLSHMPGVFRENRCRIRCRCGMTGLRYRCKPPNWAGKRKASWRCASCAWRRILRTVKSKRAAW